MFSSVRHMVFWLILFIILVVIELSTMALTTIWFAVGALVAMLLSFTRIWFPVQIIAFLAVSIVLLFMVRPWARKHFNGGRTRTNAPALIGEEALVIRDIDNLHGEGRVLAGGQEWAARSVNETENIPEGAAVIIKDIQGVKLIVERKS